MATVAQNRIAGARKKRQTSAPVGRPRIDGLVPFNLRMHRDHRAAFERICEAERVKRRDSALTLTDLIREALADYADRHDPKAAQ